MQRLRKGTGNAAKAAKAPGNNKNAIRQQRHPVGHLASLILPYFWPHLAAFQAYRQV